MRTSSAIVLGSMLGATVVWLWRPEMEEYVRGRTRWSRMKAAAGVRAIEETTGTMLDRGGEGLRRADEFLQDAKLQVSAALRAGEDAILPAGPTRDT